MARFRRSFAAALALTVVVGNAGVCAGWAATPEARMACCVGSDSCPMHHPTGDGTDATALTQAQADECCAASEPEGSTQSPVQFASTISSAVLGGAVILATQVPPLVDHWVIGTDSPPVPPSIARHVLLTVFLI